MIYLFIGLPGSGKTTVLKNMKLDVIFDDILNSPQNIREAIHFSCNGKSVGITESRMVNFSTFEKFFGDIPKSEIKMYLFMNEPEICFNNTRLRGDTKPKEGILAMSQVYSQDMNKFKPWDPIFLSCYKDEN